MEGSQKEGHHTDHGIYANEILLQENPMRFVLFPINHDAIWHMYKKVIQFFGSKIPLDM